MTSTYRNIYSDGVVTLGIGLKGATAQPQGLSVVSQTSVACTPVLSICDQLSCLRCLPTVQLSKLAMPDRVISQQTATSVGTEGKDLASALIMPTCPQT